MTTDKTKVLNMISHRSSPITAKSIAAGSFIVETDDTCPKTREVIRELIHDGYCIGSSGQGYLLLTTGKEVQEYLNSLMSRQIGISKRIQAVYNSAKSSGLL